MFREPATSRAQDADRMRFVHHQPGLVALLHIDEVLEIRDVAVGAVHAFDDDERAPIPMPNFSEQAIGCAHVVVRERQPMRAGEGRTLHRAVVHT